MNERISIGLDIGNQRLNMVKLAAVPQGLKLLDFASVGLNPIQGQEDKLRQLVSLIQQKGLMGLAVNIGVSGESVIVRYIDLPKMSKTEVAQALKYEAQQYIPFKIDEVVYDFHILGPVSSTQNRIKILLVTAKHQTIMEMIKFIQQVQLKPNIIDINAFSLINCFLFNGPKVNKGDVFALLNLEFDLVNINILDGQTPLFTRDISLWEADALALWEGQQKASEKWHSETINLALANLIREIRLSLDYFESEFEKPVNLIYISGKGSTISELVSFFSSQLEREVKLWNPLQNLIIDSIQADAKALEKISRMAAIACGLALRV